MCVCVCVYYNYNRYYNLKSAPVYVNIPDPIPEVPSVDSQNKSITAAVPVKNRKPSKITIEPQEGTDANTANSDSHWSGVEKRPPGNARSTTAAPPPPQKSYYERKLELENNYRTQQQQLLRKSVIEQMKQQHLKHDSKMSKRRAKLNALAGNISDDMLNAEVISDATCLMEIPDMKTMQLARGIGSNDGRRRKTKSKDSSASISSGSS